jgi:hypothetical protein
MNARTLSTTGFPAILLVMAELKSPVIDVLRAGIGETMFRKGAAVG